MRKNFSFNLIKNGSCNRQKFPLFDVGDKARTRAYKNIAVLSAKRGERVEMEEYAIKLKTVEINRIEDTLTDLELLLYRVFRENLDFICSECIGTINRLKKAIKEINSAIYSDYVGYLEIERIEQHMCKIREDFYKEEEGS